MALESLPKIAPALFSAEQDLLEIYNKKSDTRGTINPSYIKTSPSGVSGAIQFSDGSAFSSDASNLFWDNTNKRLGIGTNAPTRKVELVGSVASPAYLALRYGTATGSGPVLALDAGSAGLNYEIISTTNSNGSVGANGLGIYDGTDYRVVLKSGNLGIGEVTPTSRLHIKGSGSTSATSSLLVQNSAGTAALTVKDDLTSTFGGAVTAGVNNGTFADIILDFGGGTRRIRPGGNSLDLTDTLGNRAFQINAGGANPRIALEHDGVNFVRGLFSLQYTPGSTQQMVLSASNYVGHLTPFFDIKATGYANSKNTDLRLYTDNTTSGTYGNIIIGHNGTNATGNVGIGTNSINTSAITQIDSTTKGFLMPRMTTAEINAIASPANGLQVYNTTLAQPCFYDGTAWRKVSHTTM